MAAIRPVEVNTASLDRDTENIKRLLSRITTELNGMYDSVEHLNRMWTGEANKLFMKQFADDRAAMTNICSDVQNIIRSMESASKRYESGENQVRSAVDQIKF